MLQALERLHSVAGGSIPLVPKQHTVEVEKHSDAWVRGGQDRQTLGAVQLPAVVLLECWVSL
eukprot:scaffold32746_cov35-Prasinocladus_malaysianus.AAC.1